MTIESNAMISEQYKIKHILKFVSIYIIVQHEILATTNCILVNNNNLYKLVKHARCLFMN